MAVFDGGEFYTDIYDSGNSLLRRVDPSTGVATLVGPGVGAPAYAGTMVGNFLYAIGASDNYLILGTIDPAMGTGTFVSYITGMAPGALPAAIAYDNVPEPATAFLMTLCLPLLGFIYRRRVRISRICRSEA